MTASRSRAMRSEAPLGEGERRDAARRRKRWLILAAIAVLGGVPAYYVGYQDGRALAQSRPLIWSPTLAAALAGLYLVVMIGGSLLLHTVTDELDRQRGYKAASLAGLTLMLVYPIWFLLWRGGFVPEPVHWMLFALFWLSLALATLYYRFR
jgi:hypothetical protein